ncbi:glyoxylase-like metal-dependent hydrolase (beta-lactamase superfamily II) [Streptomyces sp. Amel2xB2]|nr:glyoxylase-like metal-dependent hydrolase (beta-lactamase superfamily II) [Streptomyces sp. Amel2xB2]
MKVHHLDCGTMRPPGARLVCHVPLLETAGGLVLIDSGYGLQDVADPARRLGPVRHYVRPVLDPRQTAVRQVERLGFRREDVRHIVLTHLDVDHAGGLADFPHASVHLTSAEARGAIHSPGPRERLRFRPAQWSHRPRLVEHRPDGETWRGFAAARELDSVAPGLVLLALPGHTRGHAGVAVDTGSHWLLHAGDAFYHRGTLDGRGGVPVSLRAMEAAVAHAPRRVRDNHARLRELYQRQEPDLRILCSHDPTLYGQARGES